MTLVENQCSVPSDARTILDALEDQGFAAYLVGGYVRDVLMERPTGDLDIATAAPPNRVTTICEAVGLKVVPTGIDHGTVTVVVGGHPHEVTTFRHDVETDGRHATVAFTDVMAEDAARRDFTMNALYVDRHGRVHDPLGGLPDLRARRVRFIGDAARRIAEDHLRILRFFRFHAWFANPDQGLDRDGLAACAAAAEGIENLSRERIGHEMLRLLASPDPAPALSAMHQSGILARVLPGADPQHMALLLHVEDGRTPDPIRRLALLGGEDAADRLRLSRQDANRLALLRALVAGTERPAGIAYRYGADMAIDTAILAAAMFETPLQDDLVQQAERGATAQFPVAAADLMPDLQGIALGQKLRALEQEWIDSDFRLTRDRLLS
ncbi:CCA tRNA nucleotidyltransferase [Oceaniglobus indicus]|uniref:CCA tRNA nucleotidyltransferase n=1 Tax=Oceaniglobus indicus TaxID=2047749 RepID=UPI000C1A520E|nr:CCA tRNA nucleotidyltransferase [Oceaniglobus indicus]